jgi:hypothetical protein
MSFLLSLPAYAPVVTHGEAPLHAEFICWDLRSYHLLPTGPTSLPALGATLSAKKTSI